MNRLVKRWERGRLKGWFDLDCETGAKLEALLDPLAAPRPDGPDGPDVRTARERDGDALAEVVGLALRSDRLPQHGGEPVQLTVTFRYEQLVEQIGQAMLDTGERIPMNRVRKLACECGVVPMVLGSKSEIVDIGRQTRILTAGLRRVLTARDRGCAFPGCSRPPKHCEGHHVLPWSEGGETTVRNTVLLCKRHHDLVHHSEWEVHMVEGIPLFYPPAFVDPERKPRRNLIWAA